MLWIVLLYFPDCMISQSTQPTHHPTFGTLALLDAVPYCQRGGCSAIFIGSGVRQGCKATPWLFSAFLVLFLHDFQHGIPPGMDSESCWHLRRRFSCRQSLPQCHGTLTSAVILWHLTGSPAAKSTGHQHIEVSYFASHGRDFPSQGKIQTDFPQSRWRMAPAARENKGHLPDTCCQASHISWSHCPIHMHGRCHPNTSVHVDAYRLWSDAQMARRKEGIANAWSV